MEPMIDFIKNEAIGVIIGALISALVLFFTNRSNIKAERNNINKQIEEERKNIFKKIVAENSNLLIEIQNNINENNKNRIAEHQSDRRVEWMYMVREEMANYIATCMAIKESCLPNKKVTSDSMFFQLNKSIAKMQLLFNFRGKKDKEILSLMDCITKNISSGEIDYFIDTKEPNFTNQMELLIKLTQVYLKLEWTRIKLEVEGKDNIDLFLKEYEKELDEDAGLNKIILNSTI